MIWRPASSSFLNFSPRWKNSPNPRRQGEFPASADKCEAVTGHGATVRKPHQVEKLETDNMFISSGGALGPGADFRPALFSGSSEFTIRNGR